MRFLEFYEILNLRSRFFFTYLSNFIYNFTSSAEYSVSNLTRINQRVLILSNFEFYKFSNHITKI